MTDEDTTQPVSTGLTARVADSYGADPHEHKPSQDPWDAETADEKQAATGGVGEEESSPGTSSSDSETNDASSSGKTRSSDAKPARSAVSRSGRGQKDSSSAPSTDTDSKGK